MAALTEMVDYTVEDGVAVLTLNNPPVNALSHGVRLGLLKGVEKAQEDESASAIVIYCEGSTFIAGADITEFATGPKDPQLDEVLVALEDSGKPTVAAIHGTALGGGLETAMACHYRVAVASAKCGLPEVNLGLLPGGGGTQRLPRLVGVEKALEMVTSGQPISAAEAHQLGLVDDVFDGDLRAAAVTYAKIAAQGGEHPRVRDNDEKLLAAREMPQIFDMARGMIAKRARGFLAPEYNIRCIEAAVNLPFDEGLKEERKLFMELLMGPQAQAQQYFFFAQRQSSKIPGIGKDVAERPINKVGVIGAGLMGGGIAMNMANVGIPVTIVETKQEALDRGLGAIRKNYENTAKKGRLSAEQVETRCGLIQGTLAIEDLADCDLVIEAVFENMAVKKEIFANLDRVTKPGTILASNTSALDLNEIASATNRPEDVIGLHFFSPANVMKLLEVVRGDKTADDVIKTAMAFAKRIKKVAALSGVCPGFIGNRILYFRQHQAMTLGLEGAHYAQVDKVLYDFGFPMGPFAMWDLAGLELNWDKNNSKPDTSVTDRLCENGEIGQKSGRGFYEYDEKRKPVVRDSTTEIFSEVAANLGVSQRDINDEEILDRLLLPMINEGAKILDEGIAVRASDIDVVYVYGYGWPVYRGGPMHYANKLGLDKVLEKLRHYQKQSGDDFWAPSPYLVKLTEAGGQFQ
ncbi:MAG: 3-hydroxyacyl-CoA dehydrogenase NAD-binding domain-containing protein [Proteobacteria bacterium]|jgi:3-hydroxyacyl-CoA dehydrogenase|nr:3-hydroxyacyl-CoA dehydrogenase NAD-binding domain-containing protein [Pseudomonadota bacterium]